MKCRLLLVLLSALLLGGCSWMDGSYLSVVPHQEQYFEVQTGSLSAVNYQQLRQTLANLVEAGTESAVIHVTGYQQDLVVKGIDTAIRYVCGEFPIGVYAVENIAYEVGTVGGLPAISVDISYIHGRSELRKIRRVETMEQAETVIRQVLEQCSEGVVLLVSEYSDLDIAQMIADYAEENPNTIMETPQTVVGLYPEGGRSRVVELKFTYQNSRDDLRQMQTQVQRVFASAALYVSSDGTEAQRFEQLYTFLTERFDYKIETSLTPSYSLLCHGVGDSRATAIAYAAMCRQAGVECRIVSGTREGKAWHWNMIREGNMYYHVDLLQSKESGRLRKLTDEQMHGYVWDYSAYPGAGTDLMEP